MRIHRIKDRTHSPWVTLWAISGGHKLSVDGFNEFELMGITSHDGQMIESFTGFTVFKNGDFWDHGELLVKRWDRAPKWTLDL